MDPILVDVNVHPTKLEVRLSKEEQLYQLIVEKIREAFHDRILIPQNKWDEKPKRIKFCIHLNNNKWIFEKQRQNTNSNDTSSERASNELEQTTTSDDFNEETVQPVDSTYNKRNSNDDYFERQKNFCLS